MGYRSNRVARAGDKESVTFRIVFVFLKYSRIEYFVKGVIIITEKARQRNAWIYCRERNLIPLKQGGDVRNV